MGLASVCDIVIATQEAKFGFTEARLGLIPGVISNFVVPKIGYSWARRYFVTGEIFDARRAREIGLVHELVSESHLNEITNGIAKSILDVGPLAMAECKALIERIRPKAHGDLLKETSEWIARIRVSEEGQEGTGAFLEKRPPAWVSEKS
jgi:methylglutaconyl-CoA hydratase